MVKKVGIEIGWSLIRVCVVDAETNQIETYDDQIILNSAKNGFVDPTDGLIQLWNRLDLDREEIEVSATIGLEHAGIISTSSPQAVVEELAYDAKNDLAWRELEPGLIAYIRNDYVQFLIDIFAGQNIPLGRIELAPEALSRVLKNNYSGSLTLTSGAGWNVSLEEGSIKRAATSVEVLKRPGTKVVTSNSEADLTSIRNVNLPQEVIERHQIDTADLLISAGTALSLDGEADGGFLESMVVESGTVEFVSDETVQEVAESEGALQNEIESIEEIVASANGSSKLINILGKFRQN